ncbi:MAG: enoyl-CoA hydratase/isomerase family protein, partial [Burkholderiales bacterium]
LDLALACDFRFAADTARFQCAYTRMGYAPDAGGTWRLPRLVGLEAAKRFAFTAEFWSATEALARGLVTEVHPAAGLTAAAVAFASRLAAGPTVAIAQAKRLMDGAATRNLVEQLALERRAAEICAQSADAREALVAASERRDPAFKGQ